MRKLTTAIVAMCLSTAAQAASAPTYMVCRQTNDLGQTYDFEITLDEANQRATISAPSISDQIDSLPAQFTADTVIVTNGRSVIYRFNRVTGALVRYSRSLEQNLDTGRCKVSVPVRRAF